MEWTMGGKAKKYLDISSRMIIVLFDLYYMLGPSFLQTIFPYRKGLVYVATFLFGCIILSRYRYERYSRREMLWVVSLLGAGMLSAYVTSEFTLVISAICILSAVEADKARLFQNLLFEKAGFLAVSFILSATGIISTVSGSYERLYSFFGNSVVYRRSLGFTNYNILGRVIFELIILYIFYTWQKKRKRLSGGQYIALIGIAVCAYSVSGSRTAFLCELVLLAVMKLCDMAWIRPGMLKALIMTTMAGGSWFFSEGVMILHDVKPEWYQKLDIILQARLLFIYRYMLKFGISLLGNDTTDLTDFWGMEEGFSWISLDCGYAVMMIKYGVILTLLILLVHLMYLYGKNGKRCSTSVYVLCVMLAVGFYNISENVLVFPTMNFALLYLSDIIIDKPQGDNILAQE